MSNRNATITDAADDVVDTSLGKTSATRKFGRLCGAVLLATVATLGVSASPAAASSCQSVGLVLETTTIGHIYKCTGYNYSAMGESAYSMTTNGWSGVLRFEDGAADVYFCNNQVWGGSQHIVYNIYLSPTKEPWC